MDLDVMRMRDSIPILVGDGVSESEMAFRFILFIGGSIAVIFLMNRLLKNFFGEEKKSVEDRYINDSHKKWDRIVSRGSSIVLVILLLIFWNTDLPMNIPLFLIFAILPTLVQIGFERKYAKNPNEYLYKVLIMLVGSAVILTLLFILSPGF
ncbi:MAG: DUF4181 domain-containing protein [Planococcus sp. (in: firmicutes)]|uniref:DUF4181 domain-containing protein n=1 Tax=Planococcus halocryophilus TaxID=1215089 RepID=UPI001F0F7C89|nr:DUF4181 domain-containing protein [Planococcus halocryophilus]MCH4825466.1 DUF4181 domain-containing protein [Planococcus halocryophilus]